MKISARQRIEDDTSASDEEGYCRTCSDSSSSLGTRSHCPQYSILARSVLSGEEDDLIGLNVALVHMANEDASNSGALLVSAGLSVPPQVPIVSAPILGMPLAAPSVSPQPPIIPPHAPIAPLRIDVASTSHQNSRITPQLPDGQITHDPVLARQVNEMSVRMDQLFAMMLQLTSGGQPQSPT